MTSRWVASLRLETPCLVLSVRTLTGFPSQHNAHSLLLLINTLLVKSTPYVPCHRLSLGTAVALSSVNRWESK